MSNHSIRIKLTPFQLANGLKIIRESDPDFQLISLNQLVYAVYNDCVAKTILNTTNDLSQELIDEINTLVNKKPVKKITLNSVIESEIN